MVNDPFSPGSNYSWTAAWYSLQFLQTVIFLDDALFLVLVAVVLSSNQSIFDRFGV